MDKNNSVFIDIFKNKRVVEILNCLNLHHGIFLTKQSLKIVKFYTAVSSLYEIRQF